MRALILASLVAGALAGCGSFSYYENGPITQMECEMRNSEILACAGLPEYGFGDWENGSSAGVADAESPPLTAEPLACVVKCP